VTSVVLTQTVEDQRAEKVKAARVANAHRTRRKKAMKKEHGHTHVQRLQCIRGALACF
jgi:hypothetical protein